VPLSAHIIYRCHFTGDWVNAFYKITKLLNDVFEKNNATKITDIGLGDVSIGDIFNYLDD